MLHESLIVRQPGQEEFPLDTGGQEMTRGPMLYVNGQRQIAYRDFRVDGGLLRWVSPDFSLSLTDYLEIEEEEKE